MYPVEIVTGDRAVLISIDEARELQDNLAKAIKQAADEEEELTEFEKAIKDMGHSVMFMTTECIKQKAKELLDIAFAEFKEREALHMIGEAKEEGRLEVLRYLPKWKKADRDLDAGTIDFAVFHKNDGGDFEDWFSVEVTNRLYKGEYYIELSDLDKLPKVE